MNRRKNKERMAGEPSHPKAKQVPVPGQRKKKAPPGATIVEATCLGMFLLLIAVIIFVALRNPPQMPFDNMLKMHLSTQYFIDAKQILRPQVHGTVDQWSRQWFDPNTDCREIGNGVWYAFGTVDTRTTDGLTQHQPWGLFFVAETRTLLYAKIGDTESGDIEQVKKRVPQITIRSNAH
jgi:hypothetical protein